MRYPNRLQPADIKMIEAHRYLIPSPEIASAMMFAENLVEGGEVHVYRNRTTGGLLLAYDCGGCEAHHPIIEVEFLDDADLTDRDRFLLPARGSVPYSSYLEASNGEMHAIAAPYPESRLLIDAVTRRKADTVVTRPEDLFENLPFWIPLMLNGDASYALDRETGRTAIGYECDSCDAVHADFSVDIPDIDDARYHPRYEFLGNPLLDMILEEAGERRH